MTVSKPSRINIVSNYLIGVGMKSEGWRGKSKFPLESWRLQARKATNIARNKSFGMGGMPRRIQPKTISLAKFKCVDEPGK